MIYPGHQDRVFDGCHGKRSVCNMIRTRLEENVLRHRMPEKPSDLPFGQRKFSCKVRVRDVAAGRYCFEDPKSCECVEDCEVMLYLEPVRSDRALRGGCYNIYRVSLPVDIVLRPSHQLL